MYIDQYYIIHHVIKCFISYLYKYTYLQIYKQRASMARKSAISHTATTDKKKLKETIARLENDLEVEKEKGQSNTIKLKNTNGHYSDKVRLTVLNLLRLEVATDKVGPAIQVVAENIFDTKFQNSDLPSRQTVTNISDEGQYLVKKYLGRAG